MSTQLIAALSIYTHIKREIFLSFTSHTRFSCVVIFFSSSLPSLSSLFLQPSQPVLKWNQCALYCRNDVWDERGKKKKKNHAVINEGKIEKKQLGMLDGKTMGLTKAVDDEENIQTSKIYAINYNWQKTIIQ